MEHLPERPRELDGMAEIEGYWIMAHYSGPTTGACLAFGGRSKGNALLVAARRHTYDPRLPWDIYSHVTGKRRPERYTSGGEAVAGGLGKTGVNAAILAEKINRWLAAFEAMAEVAFYEFAAPKRTPLVVIEGGKA